jgi:hypothetical protein
MVNNYYHFWNIWLYFSPSTFHLPPYLANMKMEAVLSSETLVMPVRLYGVAFQKTVICVDTGCVALRASPNVLSSSLLRVTGFQQKFRELSPSG